MQVPVDFSTPDKWSTAVTYTNGNPQSDSSQASRSRKIMRRQVSVSTPRPRPKPLPINPYYMIQQDWAINNRSSWSYPGSTETSSGGCLSDSPSGYLNIVQPPMDDLYQLAIAKLNDATRGSLDLSIDLAEAGKTAKMLKVTDQIVDYTKLTLSRFGPVKALSSGWLAWQYGLRPLLGTVYGLADENLRVVINRSQDFRVRVSESIVNPEVQTDSLWGILSFRGNGTLKRSITLGIRLRTDQFDPTRFTSLNPVSIAWELLPFSFVYDWFLNVGGYLRNMETYLLYNNRFVSGYRTDLKAGSFSLTRPYAASNGYSNTQGDVKVVEIRRSVLTSYPVPQLPSFRASLGSSRLLSSAALVGQLLGRK